MAEVKKCPEGMVYVPAGSFQMGSTDGHEDELPVRDIYLSAFCIDKHEVTNAQASEYLEAMKPEYDLFAKCGNGTSYHLAFGDDPDALLKDAKKHLKRWNLFKVKVPKACHNFEVIERRPRLELVDSEPNKPVTVMNWYDAKSFCEGLGKRLPTEAEWEKAAKGPDGNEPASEAGYDPRYDPYFGKWDVCRHPEDGYGLCDMIGNVWEWVADFYAEDAYETMAERDPTGPSEPDESGECMVIRGGSYLPQFNPPGGPRTTSRSCRGPVIHTGFIGFRCAAAPLVDVEEILEEEEVSVHSEEVTYADDSIVEPSDNLPTVKPPPSCLCSTPGHVGNESISDLSLISLIKLMFSDL